MTPGLFVLALHGVTPLASPVLFDGGSVCPEANERVAAILEHHREALPAGTKLLVRLSPEPEGAAARIEITVRAAGEHWAVERQSVNSCEEALAYLDFYLGVWTPEPASNVAATEPRLVVVAPRRPPPVEQRVVATLGAFALASSNHSSSLGMGAGGQFTLGLDWLRVGLFAAWNQPSVLSGSVDQATFTLQRWDWGMLLCGEVKPEPFAVLPCAGVSARNFTVPSAETAPNADDHARIASIDVGLSLLQPVTTTNRLEATLLARYGTVPLNLEEFAVGDFVPGQFEVNLRLGFTWDFAETNVTSAPGTKSQAAMRRSGDTW